MKDSKGMMGARTTRSAGNSRHGLSRLLAAAVALPGVAITAAHAQTAPGEPVASLKYGNYHDGQSGEDRMDIDVGMAYVRAPIGEHYEVEGSFVLDSMSGASAYYLDTLTGASGLGVEDTRSAGDIKFTRYQEDFSLSLGGQISDEDDYLSRGLSVESRIWTEDKNTVLALGVSGNSDQVTSSLNQDFSESRDTQGYFVGVTQVLDPNSIVQSNFSYSANDGYLGDPYKTLDNRPRSRDRWAWLTRYRRYFENAGGAALHADYRWYWDSWDVRSHTFEVAWYQPIGERWMVRPLARYYSQSAADFFSDQFPPEDFDRFLTFDQRLSGFGSFGGGLKIEYEVVDGFTVDAAFEYMQQRGDWKMGSGGAEGIENFSARTFLFGVTNRF